MASAADADFRQLLIADVVSDIGTFMQGVGSAWLMESIGLPAIYGTLGVLGVFAGSK
jgi:hypothetical protein